MRHFWLGVAASIVASVVTSMIPHTPLAWARDRVNAKIRADERAAAAQVDIAASLKRIAGRLR